MLLRTLWYHHPFALAMMPVSVGKYTIRIAQLRLAGTPWVVRVFRKTLLGKRLVSSDWFLEEQQAVTFVDATVKELQRDGSAAILTQRKPGWVLRAPR